MLRILRGEGQPLPCQEISERMIQVVPAMTGLIDRLEKQGLVQRKRSAEDRRVIFVELTEKAIQLLQNLDRPVSELHVELLRNLTEKEQQQLTRLLEKARRGI